MAGRIAGTLGVLALAAMMAPAVQAMGEDWSVEIAMGEAKFSNVTTADLESAPNDIFFAQYSAKFETQDATLKRHDRSYALITSYRFNRNLAMETGYFRPGAFQYAARGTVAGGSPGGSALPAGFNYSFRVKGVMLGVSTSWPLGEQLELRGRAGMSTSDTRIKYTATVQSSHYQDEWSASSQDFYLGAGVGAKLGDSYRVGIDWMLHRNIGKAGLTYSATVSNIMLSLSYQY